MVFSQFFSWIDLIILFCYVLTLPILWSYARTQSPSKAQSKLRWLAIALIVISIADVLLRFLEVAPTESLQMVVTIVSVLFALCAVLIGLFMTFNAKERLRAKSLEKSNHRLQAEVQRRLMAEQELRTLSDTLEEEIDQRTRELQDIKTKLEQEVHATAMANKRMTSIFESAPNGMLVVNQEGVITQANSMVATIFRCQPDELVGQSVETLVPQEFRGRHVHDRQAFQVKPSKRIMGARRDLYGVRFDGSHVPLEVGLHPVDLEGGAEVVAALVDISERKAYEQRIHERNAALELSNRELQEFAFIASHDLREPLRKIISFSGLLQEGEYGAFNEEGKEFSGYIVSAAYRMRDLLDDLLTYSRVTSQANPFKLVRLNALMEEVLDDLQLAIEDVKAQVIVHPLPDVMADQVQMRQLFQNLISNSLKYHHPERSPVIEIKACNLEQVVKITVQDNGLGFAKEYREQIFEVFKRLHDKQSYPGTGMGLAICRKIIQRHHGIIFATAEVGQGACFHIELPKQQDLMDSRGKKNDIV